MKSSWFEEPKMQAKVQPGVELKDSIKLQMSPNWVLGIWTTDAHLKHLGRDGKPGPTLRLSFEQCSSPVGGPYFTHP